jgi:hypothetical protein
MGLAARVGGAYSISNHSVAGVETSRALQARSKILRAPTGEPAGALLFVYAVSTDSQAPPKRARSMFPYIIVRPAASLNSSALPSALSRLSIP